MTTRPTTLRAALAASAAALLLLAAGAASAAGAPNRPQGGQESNLITGEDIDKIVQALEDNGFTAEVSKDSYGDPYITGDLGSTPYSLSFYGCNDEHEACTFVQFAAGWDMEDGVAADVIESWNAENVWGQAYRDDENDPWLSMPLNLFGGVTEANFSDSVDWWKVILGEYEDHIGWND